MVVARGRPRVPPRAVTHREDLVAWENSNDERVLGAAKAEIERSTGGDLPPLLDPFAGGGAIPLEAQRLGLEAYAQDLNPVAVTINKAMIEIPPLFAGKPAVNPDAQARSAMATWEGNTGLAADVEHYGNWMREEASRRIGHLYPKVKVPNEQGGGRGDGHRVDLGAHREVPQPRLRPRDHPRALLRPL